MVTHRCQAMVAFRIWALAGAAYVLLWIVATALAGVGLAPRSLIGETVSRRLTYCLPLPRFQIGVGPFVGPFPLGAGLLLAGGLLHAALLRLGVSWGHLAFVWCAALVTGAGILRPALLSHWHFGQPNIPYVLANVARTAALALIASIPLLRSRYKPHFSVPVLTLLVSVLTLTSYLFSPIWGIE